MPGDPNYFRDLDYVKSMLAAYNVATTGRLFFVSNSTVFPAGAVLGANDSSYGDHPWRPFSTIAYCNDNHLVANRGDVVVVGPGHIESVVAIAGLDLDIAGTTFVFLGSGTNQAAIRFGTAVGADMDIDAANIRLVRPRFIANIDALTGPIDVNSAYFRMDDARWQDGTTINTTDVLVADAGADNMFINGFEFVDGDAAGTQKQSFIQIAGATGVKLKDIKCTGDFGTGIIENGTAWIDAELRDCNLDNASASPTVAILLQATSTGSMHNCHLRVASGTTYLTANNDMQFFECFGTGTDATAGEKIGTILAGDLEAKIDVIDEFMDVPAANNVLNAQTNEVIGNKEDTTATGAVTTTDTLVAYTKQLVTELQVVDEFHDVPAADNVLNAQINEVIGNKTDAAQYDVAATRTLVGYTKGLIDTHIMASGTFTTSSATVPADTGRTEANDYWNGCYLVPTAGAIAFEPRLIVDFANAGGVFTLDTDIPFTAVPGTVAYAIIPGNVQIAPQVDSTATQTPAHVIGRKTDAAIADTIEGAVATTQSLHALAKSALQRLGADSTNNTAATTLVAANGNGSLLERAEALQVAASPSNAHPNYFTVVADMTSATWNTVAAHEIATVTGVVRMQIIAEVTATVITVGTNGTIALGYQGNTSAIFSATALDAALTGDVFSAVYGSAATTPASGADAQSSLTHGIFDVVVVGGLDVGYTIATNAGTTGNITFHIWWQPLSSTGAVTAGAGGVL